MVAPGNKEPLVPGLEDLGKPGQTAIQKLGQPMSTWWRPDEAEHGLPWLLYSYALREIFLIHTRGFAHPTHQSLISELARFLNSNFTEWRHDR